MKSDWEKVSSLNNDNTITYRMPVIGGWLVLTIVHSSSRANDGTIFSHQHFINDPDHLWDTEFNKVGGHV